LHDAVTEHGNTGTSFGKARKLQRGTEDWFARRNFLVRAVDVSVFAEVAPGGLCDDKVVALEFGVIRQSASAPSGLKMAVSPWIAAMP
jgi:hypothetical protein